MNKKLLSISVVVLVVIVAVVGGLSWKYRDVLTGGASDSEKEVRMVVGDFGKQLKNIPLMADREILVDSIEKNYGRYASEELLAAWRENPERAPGRLASSPWPDRIEILLIERQDDGAYEVQGEVVEVTSVEAVSGGRASAYQVALKLRERDGRWVITGLTKAIQAE